MALRLTPVNLAEIMWTWLAGVSERHTGVPPSFLHTTGLPRLPDPEPCAAFQSLLGISTHKPPLTLPELVNRSQP